MYSRKKAKEVCQEYLSQLVRAENLLEGDAPKIMVERTSKLVVKCGLRGVWKGRSTIIISAPLLQMIEDIAAMHASWLVWTGDNATQLLHSGNLTPETMRSAFDKAISSFFDTKRQWPNFENFRLFSDEIAEGYAAEMRRFGTSRLDFAQMYADQMILFLLAHELGHIRLGHLDQMVGATIKNEQSADNYAADLVFKKVYSSMEMEKFGLPYDFWAAGATSAVALIFMLNSAFEKAAAARNSPWLEYHSPAFERFASFKNYCISEIDIPLPYFCSPVAFHPPAQMTFDLWQAMILGCQFEPNRVS